MPIIEISELRREFQVYESQPGFSGFFKNIFQRQYKTVKAVDKVSFQINEGELVGFIGPNGAGKTTTLKCLAGLLYPTSGVIAVGGYNPWERKNDFLKAISLIAGQKNQLIWDLPAMATFNLNKEIYELSDHKFKETLSSLTELLEIEDLINLQVRRLSLGQRMRCELAAALLHRPKILFLDEPTIGLDVVMQQKMRDFIKKYNRQFQATVLLTSHYMEDVRELCKRVMIIDKGNLVFDGNLSEIVEKYAPYKTLEVVFAKEFDLKKLDEIGEVTKLDFPKAEILVRREVSNSAAAELLHHFPVDDLNIKEVPIEQVVRKIFTRD